MEALGYIILLALAVMGMPLFAVMAGISLWAFAFADVDSSAVTIEMYRLASAPSLLTIPLFTVAGYVMARSRAPERLFQVAHLLFGRFPGGIAIVSLVVCAFFTAFTGASGVTIIALGGLLLPMLQKQGYHDRFSLGLITASGSLGLLFAPSLPLILYGIVAKVDIDQLFLAGIVPGIFLIVVLAGWSLLFGKRKPFFGGQGQRATEAVASTEQERADFHEEVTQLLPVSLWHALCHAKYDLLLPIFVIAGIYGGITTVTETAALTAAYVIIVQCFVHRDIRFKTEFPKIVQESMSLVGAILLILCSAMGLTNYLVDEDVPAVILEFLQNRVDSKLQFLMLLNLFLLAVGSLMDIFSAIVIVVPLIVPVAAAFEIHPVHLAMIFLTNLEIGYLTPPVGINLFITSFRFNRSLLEVYKAAIPMMFVLFIALLVITYFPQLSLWLLEP